MTNPVFDSVQDMLAALLPSYPVMCFWPDRIAMTAKRFLDGFPGKVLYAVKCNPDKRVIQTLSRTGVAAFDCASLEEIRFVLFNDDNLRIYKHLL